MDGIVTRAIRTKPGAVAAAGIVLLSIPTFLRPWLADMQVYAHIADKLLNGWRLYQDALDTKPPFIFFHYALVFRLFGENNTAAVKCVTMLFLAITAWLLVRVHRAMAPGAGRTALVAPLFVLASFSGWGEDFLSSNTEILANVFIVAGCYGLVTNGFAGRAATLFLSGCAIGVACLYRFQSGAILLAYFLLLIGYRRHFGPSILWRLASVGAGTLVAPGIVVACYAWVGGLDALRVFAALDFSYVRGAEIYWLEVLAQVGIVVASQFHFLVLATWQAWRLVHEATRTMQQDFLLLFAGCSILGFFVGGHYFAHYAVQSTPAFALLAADWLADPPALVVDASATWIARVRAAYARRIVPLIVAHVLIFTVINTVYYWPQNEPADPYPALTRFARALTTKHDPVFVWGKTSVLFPMDRVFATRFLARDLLIGRIYGSRHRLPTETAEGAWPAAVQSLWPMLMSDLQSSPPRVIIDDVDETSNFTIRHYPELQAFVARNYEPCHTIDVFCVYVRRDLKSR